MHGILKLQRKVFIVYIIKKNIMLRVGIYTVNINLYKIARNVFIVHIYVYKHDDYYAVNNIIITHIKLPSVHQREHFF